MDDEVDRSTQTADADPDYALGVLFVHGIGNQTIGSTLADFGTPLVEWLQTRADVAKVDVTLGKTMLADATDEPASSEVTLTSGNETSRWLLAESYWAESFQTARFNDVARWSLLIVPRTIGIHFAKRLVLAAGAKRPTSVVSAMAALVGALLLSPAILLVLTLLLLLGMIPLAPLRSLVASIQRGIASSLGDSYMLVIRPIEAQAIRSRVRHDLAWLVTKCRKVAVVAHSQGAAIACQVVGARDASISSPNTQLLITFGSGLRKLEELEEARRDGELLKGAILSVAALFIAALSISAAPLVGYQVYTHTASPASAVALAILATVGVLIGIAGIQDLVHATEPAGVKRLSRHLTKPRVLWEDLYASADPVSNGPVRDGGATPPNSTEVVNLQSAFRDHTTYWQNRDGFVALIADILIAFDGAGILQPTDPATATFLRTQRAIRVRVLQALGWFTAGCVIALLIQHFADWLAVAAWANRRALAWAGSSLGYTLPTVPVPSPAVWRRSVGWLAAVAAASWLTRVLWTMWNNGAMTDAARGIYRIRQPFSLLLALAFQLAFTAVAVSASPNQSSATAIIGLLLLLIPTAIAQGRSPVPPAQGSTPRPSSSSAVTAAQALWKLFQVGVILAVPLAAFLYAMWRMHGYLASRVENGVRWAILSAILLFVALLGVFIRRRLMALFERAVAAIDGP